MKQFETRLTPKGQVTIPAEIRVFLGLKPKDFVRFEVEGNEVKLKPVSSKLLEGYGAVTPREKPEDWRKVRADAERAMAEDTEVEGR